MRTVRILLIGLGNLGRRFCEILHQKHGSLKHRYGVDLRLVGGADSGGAAYDPASGLAPALVAEIKARGDSISSYPEVGKADWKAIELIKEAQAEVVLEASPVHWSAGAEPGLTCIRTALKRRMHVVTPNKGPMILAYRELHDLAALNRVQLRFDGTVAGGLPVLYLGQRDLRGAVIQKLELVPNLVTGLVMDLLSEGADWNDAVETARREGALEGDGSWDLDGFDAAAKLVLIANAVLEVPLKIESLSFRGIRDIDRRKLVSARERGEHYRMLAAAHRQSDGQYRFSVESQPLPSSHPLSRLGPRQLGTVFHTDIYGTITAVIDEIDPIPSAATMLRDLLDIYC